MHLHAVTHMHTETQRKGSKKTPSHRNLRGRVGGRNRESEEWKEKEWEGKEREQECRERETERQTERWGMFMQQKQRHKKKIQTISSFALYYDTGNVILKNSHRFWAEITCEYIHTTDTQHSLTSVPDPFPPLLLPAGIWVYAVKN